MPVPAYTAAAIREAERPLLEAGHGARLMRTAAAGLASACRRALLRGRGRVTGTRVVVLAGPGNNGGDALFAAADLSGRGAAVTVVAPLGQLHEQGAAAARRAGVVFGAGTENARANGADSGEPALIAAAVPLLASAHLVIDGLLGTGARLPLRAPLLGLIAGWQEARQSGVLRPGRPGLPDGTEHPSLPGSTGPQSSESRDGGQIVVAVDMPTGVDASTGERGEVCVRADITVTFGGCKAGQFLPGGAEACGRVDLVDIGLDLSGAASAPELRALDDADLADWPLPEPHDHKYTRGVLGVIAGSATYPGAGVLTATAAIGAGVGMLRVQGAAAVQEAVVAAAPEAVSAPGRVQAWTMGPGAPDAQDMMEFLMEAIGAGTPLALDAGALAIMPGLVRAAHGTPPLPAGSILTPHAGELASLLEGLGRDADRDRIEADPARWAREAARAVGAVILLKGHRTLIAVPDGRLWAPAPGPAALATAGSGDVLAGLVGAALATGLPPQSPAPQGRESDADPHARTDAPDRHARTAELAALAVLLHNRAGRQATHASALPDLVAREVSGLARSSASRPTRSCP